VFGELRVWLDHRTGYRKVMETLLLERIPGGAKWRYVWGSCLAFIFTVQLVTGVLLMTSYSASDSTAWSSVYFIQYEMDFGWLIRGLHHFGSQTMVVLLGLHMLQVVIAGAHLPPREVNWWLGLALLAAVLGLSLTGYLLPWDQKGYWATQVATNIAGNLPVAGPAVQKIVVGGPVYGNHTLTRFYALHVAILPPLVIVLIIAHLAVFRRHGVTTPKKAQGEGWFWPDQAFRDLVVSLVIFAIMLGLVVYGHGHKIESAPGATGSEPSLYQKWAHAGRDGRGANLDAPADSARPYPARPEWYFLFLFQLLKYFEGQQEIIGTVVIPNAVLVLLFLLPLLGYGRIRKVGHVFGVVVIVALLISVGTLTYLAIAADRPPGLTEDEIQKLPPGPERQQAEKSLLFQKETQTAEALAARAIQLASKGIPVSGPVNLLRHDPLTRGKELFGQHCATCHNHGEEFQKTSATASDLAGFGTKEWILGLLHEPKSPHYFGQTKLTGMATYVKSARTKALRKEKNSELPELNHTWDLAAEWLADHPHRDLPSDATKDHRERFVRGAWAFQEECLTCHKYKGETGGTMKAPDFTGYGDADWVRLMLMSPAHELRYGRRNAMPAFRDLEGLTAKLARLELQQQKDLLLKEIRDDDPEAEVKQKQVEEATKTISLSDIDRELIIRWLLKDYRVVFGGEPISGPPKR
jgi:ubiquinol-cytochrome c reductase cytochrome b subunit